MNEQELKEIIKFLQSAGMQVQLGDTPVGVSANPAQCGLPTSMEDERIDDYILLPKLLVGHNPYLFVPVRGDSMIDAGYEEGDLLRVQVTYEAADGDNVLVAIGRDATVKTLFHYEDGTTWLIPQNDNFDPIPLDESDEEVRILGIVRGVEKKNVRVPYKSCADKIKAAKRKIKKTRNLDDKSIDEAIIKIGEMVKHARQWYAVFRAMVDLDVVPANGCGGFCERVARLLPNHAHLPAARELQRMAVQSFARPVTMWVVENAPVTGVRFRDYLSIAQKMNQLLTDFAV